jgi:hypothetical protein
VHGSIRLLRLTSLVWVCVALLILKDPCTKVHRTEVDYTFCVMTMANTHRLCVANSVCVKVVPTFKPEVLHVLTISVQTGSTQYYTIYRAYGETVPFPESAAYCAEVSKLCCPEFLD